MINDVNSKKEEQQHPTKTVVNVVMVNQCTVSDLSMVLALGQSPRLIASFP
jgi:hypothetical protein